MADEKLQKVLARAGLGSRREIEGWIKAGLVKVNGQLAKLGDRVTEQDQLFVRGRLISQYELSKPETEVILYHKPENELVTRSDEQGRETVFARLPKPKSGRWIAIGRLDVNTTGLLLFTNNGELANRLMHPSYQVERSYLVRVFGEVDKDLLKRLETGVMLDDGMANFDKVTPLKSTGEPTDSLNRWYQVSLLEGRNREVRRLWESQGVQVSRLKRTAFAGIKLPKTLRQGKTLEVTLDQLNQLLNLVDLPAVNYLATKKTGLNRRRDVRPRTDDEQNSRHRSAPRDAATQEALKTVYNPQHVRRSLPSPHAKQTFAVKDGQASHRLSRHKSTNQRSATSNRINKGRTNWRDNDDDYID